MDAEIGQIVSNVGSVVRPFTALIGARGLVMTSRMEGAQLNSKRGRERPLDARERPISIQ